MTDYTSNPTANDEFTQMIQDDRYARTLANIARRAENLWEDGYSAKLETATAHFQHYAVTTPTGDRYNVCLSNEPTDDVFGDYCTCPAFGKFSTCKHLLALQWLAGEDRQAAEFDRLMESAETSEGCDSHAEW